MRKLGRAVGARFGIQANASTPAAGTPAFVPFTFYEITPPADPGIQDDPLLGAAMQNTRDPIAGVRELRGGQLRMSVPLDLAMLPHWMRHAFGSGVQSGSNPNYVHSFVSGSPTLPYVTFEVAYTSGDVVRHVGAMCDSFALRTTKDPAYARLDLVYLTRSHSYETAVIGTGTIATNPAVIKPTNYRWSALFDAIAMGDLLEGSFAYGNAIDRYNVVDGSEFSAEMDPGLASLAGSLRTRLRDRTLRQISLTDAVKPLVLQISHPSDAVNKAASFTLSNIRLMAQGGPVSGPGGIDESFNFRAEQTDAVPAIGVAVKNQSLGTVYGY